MYFYLKFKHTINGDYMDLSIRKNIYENIKNDSEETLLKTINESVNEKDEVILPGLGVMFEYLWDNSTDEEKENFVKKIKTKINNLS